MDPDPGSSKSWRWPWSKSKGSVQRARQMMETGQRPSAPEPSPQPQEPSNDSAATAGRVTQWPLLDSRDLNNLGPNRSPRGAPRRPARPEGSGPTGLGITLPPARSFSQSFSRPLPTNRDSSGASRSGSGPNISVTNEERSRWSAATDSTSESTGQGSSSGPPKKAMGLLPPQAPPLSKSARHTFNRRSSVSPIPEELSENMSHRNSHALSMSLTDSPSTGRESDIYSSFLEDESLDWQQARTSHRDNGEGLVRQASLGKRGKPSLRVIQKPSKTSLAASEGRPSTSDENTIGRSMPKAIVSDAPPLPNDGLKVPSPKGSYSSLSDRSYEFDLEKGAFVLDVGQGSSQQAQSDFPRAAPTMSDKRPNAPKPPRLDLGAVHDAEARGSLTSLPDLIRRATRLASNLDNGRTASRTGMLQSPRVRDRQRNSRASNLDDTLASFPPPPRDRSSWPAFFRRSTLHNVETLNSATDSERDQPNDCSRRCCGMPLWLFITVCVALVIIISLAILLPVFLVAVPKQNSGSPCEQSTPCENGGVSVSSGSVCSCICTNGYTGAQCNIPGDVGCTTTAIDGRSAAKSATMGSSLPKLFQESRQFSIPLDPVTSMALFNKDDVSCTAQNELVSVKSDAQGANKDAKSDSKQSTKQEHAKRAATSNGIVYDSKAPTAPTDSGPTDAPAPTNASNDPAPTDDPAPTNTSKDTADSTNDKETCTGDAPAAAPTANSDSDTTTHTTSPTSTSTSTTSSPTATSTSTSGAAEKTLFARVAVLYIFQSTGKMAAGTQARENIAAYLSGGGSGVYTLDLSKAGVNQKVSVDFEKYRVKI